MSLKERENAILGILSENGQATVEELCRRLFVSQPTVRRDLSALSERGLIVRTHGGARARNAAGQNLPQEIREREHAFHLIKLRQFTKINYLIILKVFYILSCEAVIVFPIRLYPKELRR